MKRNNKILILIFAIILYFPIFVMADDSNTRSIVGDFFNKVFDVSLTDGKTIFETNQDIEEREKINHEIYNNNSQKHYSLYDRFGGHIQFIPYYGETKISTNLADKFYTKFVYRDEKFTLSIDDIKKLFSSPAISNNIIYDGRPDILSSQEITSNKIDPRVYAYSGISLLGGETAIGNTLLLISTTITKTISWFSGSNLFIEMNKIWNQLCDSYLIDIMKFVTNFFLPIALFCFIIYLFSITKKLIKGIEGGVLKRLITNFLGAFISVGLVLFLMTKPMVFSQTITTMMTYFDNILDNSLNEKSNEVSNSDYNKNVRIAKLWNKTVFEPWCQGMFGDEYNNLYTQFDSDASHNKLKQSNDPIDVTWSDNSIKYNSANITGDVVVNVGKEKDIRNWAALAWSTNSIYHIDAVKDSDSSENNDNNLISGQNVWPKASLTPQNSELYIDNFRWIDAKLNISPEYKSPEYANMNFSNSNNYNVDFRASGFRSLYLSLLLIPIGILTYKKLYYVLLTTVAGIRLWGVSILNLVMPEKYNIFNNVKKVFSPLYDTIWWSMTILLAIITYDKMAGKTLIGDIIWLIVGIWLCKFKPIKSSSQVRSIKNKIKSQSYKLGNKIKNKFSKK